GTFTLRLRIGVHSGNVFAAQVGDIEHIELVVTGRNINRVALAQEIAEPGEVVISKATSALLPQAHVEERQSGFVLLHNMPTIDLLGDDCDTAVSVLNAYYRRAQEVVHRYGGIVNKVDMYTFGDKLMALFGAPAANEDDPLRAARAALELRGALTQANHEIFGLLNPQIGRLIQVDPQF